MRWLVEGWVDADGRAVVDHELTELASDPALTESCDWLIGWLQALSLGEASPEHEPALEVDGTALRFRTMLDVVMIFALEELLFDFEESARLVVLRFARAASGFATVSDLRIAAERWRRWEG